MDNPTTDGARSARAAGKVSIAVLISRILGLVRDQFFAKLFGAGLFNDAWIVALRIPNLLRDLFAEGALSAAFLPTFTENLRNRGREQAFLLANLVLSCLLILLGMLAVFLFFFSESFVTLLAAGYRDVPGKVEITSVLIRILSPFLMLIAMATVAMGVLNALNHYFLPALAPAFFNVALILAAIFLVPEFAARGIVPIYAMGVGAIVGGILQFAVQIPLLRREGFRFHFRIDLHHPGIRRILRLIGPAIIGVSAVQLNVLVNTQLASFLQDNGPVSWLNYAFRIMYMPIGLFGVAVGVVNLREVSVFAAGGRIQELKETVANSVKMVSFLAIPSTVGLIVLAAPIIDVIFERGDFTASDTRFTSYALIAYALGLFAYSCNKVYVPTFYALDDTKTPVRISVLAVAINIVINVTLIILLPAGLKFVGLALGTAISVSASNSLLGSKLRGRVGSFREFKIIETVLKNLMAALFMGMGVYWVDRYFRIKWGDMTQVQEVMALGAAILIGILIYILVSRLLKVRELHYLTSTFLR
jgi:putative peptidoglycan lipid II flippase